MNNTVHNPPICGTDRLGRTIPIPGIHSTERENKQVGLFYFLWLSDGNRRLFNIQQIIDSHPDAGAHPEADYWGSEGVYHFWDEPFYGYYSMNDEWVIRHHMKLIMNADIDFLFFDTTNYEIYESVAKTVMRILQEYHDLGHKIPKVMFYTNTLSGKCAQKIYDAFYKTNYCSDTWYYFDGKPLIIAIEEDCSQEVRDFFTIKKSQWPNEATKSGGWPWMDFERPQRVFENENGIPEVINVSVAQHPQCRFGDNVLYGETANRGRSFHNGANDFSPNAFVHGYNFSEQFERALETDPPVVLVTGWNEWIAGRWHGPDDRPIMFVDCVSDEYSRDIEMMRGGYFDNYYMQLISYVRQYKGCPAVSPAAISEKTVYQGFNDGSFERNHEGWTPEIIYKNESSRNSISSVSVSHDTSSVYFEIKTSKPLSADISGSFFNIYISLPKSDSFDYVANIEPDICNNCSKIAKLNNNGDSLCIKEIAGKCLLNVAESCITVTINLSDIGNPKEILFKIADSKEAYKKVEDFYDKGDVFPIGRPSFLYRM